MKIEKGFTTLNLVILFVALFLIISLVYGAATHLSGPIVSGTKAQGDTANIATGAGEIYAANDIEADGNLNVAGTATIGGTVATSTITVSGGQGIRYAVLINTVTTTPSAKYTMCFTTGTWVDTTIQLYISTGTSGPGCWVPAVR